MSRWGFPSPTEASERPHPVRQPSPRRSNRGRNSTSRVGTPTVTSAHASENTRGFCRSGTTTLRTEVRRAHANARASPRIHDRPPKGPRIHPQPPEGDGVERTINESTELLLPRSVFARQAWRRLDGPSGAEASLALSLPDRRSPEGDPLARRRTKESRPTARKPRGASARTRDSHGRSEDGCEGRRTPPRRCSLPAASPTKVVLAPASPISCRNSRAAKHIHISRWRSPEGDHPLDPTVRSKSRVVPAHATAKAAGSSGTTHLIRRRGVSRRAPSPTDAGFDPRQRHRFRRMAPSLTEHGNRPDAPRAVCSPPHPRDRQKRKTARSEGPTTPPMGFGAFRRNQPW